MTRLLRCVLVAVALLSVTTWAAALVPLQQKYLIDPPSGYVPAGPLGPVGSAAAACDLWYAAYDKWFREGDPSDTTRKTTYAGYDPGVGSYGRCKATNSFGGTSYGTPRLGPQACPANSSAVSGGCQCNANFDEVGGECKPHVDQCSGQTGKTGVLNWTEGYTRTPDEGDRKAVGSVYSPPSSGNVCLGSCAVSLQTSGPGVQPLVSQAPTSQGLYRRSVDYPYVALGTSCNPGTADVGADKNATPPDCPGTVGEYSGHPVCVGTAAKPVIASGMPQAPGATPIAGNPTAGDKPSTGEGSGSGSAGRTPSGGDGTAKGGPADAGKGGKGGEAGGTADGTGVSPKRTDDKEPDACGAPGQPECSVRVNEKGTPEGAGTTFDTAKAKLDETKGKNDENLAKVSGSGDKGFLEPIRSLFWAPPVAACETFDLPQQVGGLKIDPCSVVDGVRNVMAFLWAATGLFLCFRMIKGSF